jgi:activator of 2-hydroxyglutaryl-CoA dehydratase
VALLSEGREFTFKTLQEKFQSLKTEHFNDIRENVDPLFKDEEDYINFLLRHNKISVPKIELKNVKSGLFLGIDAGSTTTKAVLINKDKAIAYSYYGSNQGNPLKSTVDILNDIYAKIPSTAQISGACVTGYG